MRQNQLLTQLLAVSIICLFFSTSLIAQSVTVGECSGCNSEVTVTFDGCDDCVDVSSCKDLSNVVLLLCDSTEYKYDNLNQGQTGTFCSPDGQDILGVWVKSGCNQSGDGPGYGVYVESSCGSGGGNLPTESVTAGSCSGCDSENTVTFYGCSPCVDVSSCKDLSNVVIKLCDGSELKFDDLNQGQTGTFCAPDSQNIIGVWVKSGCNSSNDGPGYGRYFSGPCDENNCDGEDNVCQGPSSASRSVRPGSLAGAPVAYLRIAGSQQGNMSFEVQAIKDGNVRLQIIDFQGNLQGMAFQSDVQAGHTYTFDYNTQQLEPGLYFYRMEQSNGQVSTGKMLVSN